jgi:hypothetical protein
MVALLKIDLREHPTALEGVEYVIDAWHRKLVKPRVTVKESVVNAHAKCTILFPREEDWVPIWGHRRPDPTLCKQRIKLDPDLR